MSGVISRDSPFFGIQQLYPPEVYSSRFESSPKFFGIPFKKVTKKSKNPHNLEMVPSLKFDIAPEK